jgi:hypothetical protein
MTSPPGSPGFVARAAKHRYSLELQWQGRGGRFHHLAFSPRGLWRALGTFCIVAVLALVGVSSLPASRAEAPVGIDAFLRENLELKARQDALRERAYDLAEQLYWHAAHELRMVRLADIPGDTWAETCARPPGREAGDEAILAWLSEQGVRLEAFCGGLPAAPVEAGERRSAAQASSSNRKYVQER